LIAICFGAGLSAAERQIDRVFAVKPGCALKIDTYRGAIAIEESDHDEIRVALHLDAEAEQEARAARSLENVQVDLGLVDNCVTVVVRNPRESGFHFTWQEDEPVNLRFKILVPRKCDVSLKVVNGNAVIGNLAGRLTAHIDSGGVFFRNIDGSVHAQVDYGDVIVSRCSGPVTAHVLRGLIRVGTMGSRTELINTTGDIEVMAVRSSLRAETQMGDIRVGFATALAADSQVTASGGSIIAGFQAQTACRVDAAASWGRVNSALPLTIESGAGGKRTLVGRLNGGGPLVQLRASGGSVTLTYGVPMIDEEG